MKYDEWKGILDRLNAAIGGEWGVMRDGPRGDGKPWSARMEAAPGLTIGSTANTEPIARCSGYLMPVEANADFLSHARCDILLLVAEVTRLNAEPPREEEA